MEDLKEQFKTTGIIDGIHKFWQLKDLLSYVSISMDLLDLDKILLIQFEEIGVEDLLLILCPD